MFAQISPNLTEKKCLHFHFGRHFLIKAHQTILWRFSHILPKFPQILPGLRRPNHCVGRRKGPTMSQVLSSIQYICFLKTSVSNMGPPNLLIVPGAIQPCNVPGMGLTIEVQQTIYINIFIFDKLFLRPQSKWRPWHMPCLPYPRYATVCMSWS